MPFASQFWLAAKRFPEKNRIIPGMNRLNTTPALLALDWGKTRIKAYLVSPDGEIIDTRTGLLGVQKVADHRFVEALHTLCGDWLNNWPEMPILACGMIGSREGLCETPFASTPTIPAGLTAKAVRIDEQIGRRFAIIPGICDSPLGQPPDVIRGMETRILGALDLAKTDHGIFVLPGTHSKWVKVKNGAIDSFRTYMTGELFAILRSHSILGQLMPAEPVITPEGFARGLANARLQPASLTHILFSVRTLALSGDMAVEDLPGYLSGLLIGDELADGLRWASSAELTLIGSGELTELYRKALTSNGHKPKVASAAVAARGLFRLAQEINW